MDREASCCNPWDRKESDTTEATQQQQLLAYASKVMLKILQARLQQYVNRELLDVQAGFRKGRGTSDQVANICWIIEKAKEFQKTSISTLMTLPSL